MNEVEPLETRSQSSSLATSSNRAFLVGVRLKNERATSTSLTLDESLDELAALVRASPRAVGPC